MKTIKVIKIIDTERIVINVGSSDGVSYNWRFEICGHDEVVRDIDTGEALGALRDPKATIRPIKIHARMTECVNAESMGNTFDKLAAALAIHNSAIPLSLNVNPDDITGKTIEVDKIINVGDAVVRIEDYKTSLKLALLDVQEPESSEESESSEEPC